MTFLPGPVRQIGYVVEPPNSPAAVIEISELTEVTAANAIFVHDAAAEWDGNDPIRLLGG